MIPLPKLKTILSTQKTQNGPPGEIRTPDTQVRSLVLYPAELRAEDAKLRFTGGKGQGTVCIAIGASTRCRYNLKYYFSALS